MFLMKVKMRLSACCRSSTLHRLLAITEAKEFSVELVQFGRELEPCGLVDLACMFADVPLYVALLFIGEVQRPQKAMS
jgi:hypothetical protein